MTTACDMPRVNNRAAANRRASNAAMRRRPRGGLVMPQHRIVLDELHHFISRDSLVPCQLTSPYFVLGRRQPSTYTYVRLGLPPPSGLVWLAIWPGTGTSPVPEFLQFGFMQRAFAAGAATALIFPLIAGFLLPPPLSLTAHPPAPLCP